MNDTIVEIGDNRLRHSKHVGVGHAALEGIDGVADEAKIVD